MAEKEVKGAVYSMVEFNGKLLASINSTVRPSHGLSSLSCAPGPQAFSPFSWACVSSANDKAVGGVRLGARGWVGAGVGLGYVDCRSI